MRQVRDHVAPRRNRPVLCRSRRERMDDDVIARKRFRRYGSSGELRIARVSLGSGKRPCKIEVMIRRVPLAHGTLDEIRESESPQAFATDPSESTSPVRPG